CPRRCSATRSAPRSKSAVVRMRKRSSVRIASSVTTCSRGRPRRRASGEPVTHLDASAPNPFTGFHPPLPGGLHLANANRLVSGRDQHPHLLIDIEHLAGCAL